MPVTCGRCNRIHSIVTAGIHADYTGFCVGCSKTKYLDDMTLPNGSVIHYSRREGKRVPVTCGRCRTLRVVNCDNAKLKTGFCTNCKTRRIEDVMHRSGTIVHWGIREQNETYYKGRVLITCHACRQQSFFNRATVDKDGWSSLCTTCSKQRYPLNKYTRDERLPTGSVIHWGDRDPEHSLRVRVTCGKCAESRYVRPATGAKARSRWTGFCPKHYLDFISGSFYEQSRPRKRGPKSGNFRFDRSKFLAAVGAVVISLRKKGNSIHRITRDAVAEQFQLQGEDLSGVAIKVRLKECGVTVKWREYVESVLQSKT